MDERKDGLFPSTFDGLDYRGYEVSVRLVRDSTSRYEPVALSSPRDAYLFLKPLENLDREAFWRIDLNVRNQVTGCEEVSRGHLTGALVHPREVYKGAILNSAASIIIAHNHPSGDATPSSEDRAITRRLYDAGSLLGIPLVDHVVVGDNCYWSMAERGSLG